MSRPADPYKNFKFRVTIGGNGPEAGAAFSRTGFSSVSGLNQELEVIEYREGGDPSTMRKMPGQASFDDVVLERGLSSDQDFVSWIQEVYSHNKGFTQLPQAGFRRRVRIELFDKDGIIVRKTWVLHHCWPRRIEYDDLTHDGNDVLFNRIELCHEGLEMIAEGQG